MPTLASPSAISRARSLAAAARRREAGEQRRVVGIEAEADDVHRGVGEGHRDLDAGEVGQAGAARGGARARWPPISSWSVSAQSSTPFALARAASASGSSVPSETVEWQCRSAFERGPQLQARRPGRRRHARSSIDLQGVVVDRAAKSLTAVGTTRVELQLKGADLAAFLGRWLGEPRVTLAPPDRIAIVGTPRLGGIALGGAGAAELQGRLVGQGSELFLTIERIRLGRGEAPPLARAILERAINPIFDVADAPLPTRLDAVEVGADDTIRIAASGSRLPQAAP